MRHRRKSKHFGRRSEERVALGRALVVGFLLSPERRIVTTVAKAKWVCGLVDSVCCELAKLSAGATSESARLSRIRRIASQLGGRHVLGQVMRGGVGSSCRPNGGNVRVQKLASRRLGDSGKTAVLELVR